MQQSVKVRIMVNVNCEIYNYRIVQIESIIDKRMKSLCILSSRDAIDDGKFQ